MERTSWISALATVLLVAMPSQGAEVIDRIVATVNGHIILQSEWDDGLNFEALTGDKAITALTAEERKAAFERLIDQELLREQIRVSEPRVATDDEVVTARVLEIRKQHSDAVTDQGWHDLLSRFDLTDEEVRARVALQFNLLRLVDDRLRPGTDVDDKAVQEYYTASFLPQLRQSGAAEVPLTDVAAKIRELLTQQKLNESLADWLKTLREASVIRLQSPDGGGTQ